MAVDAAPSGREFSVASLQRELEALLATPQLWADEQYAQRQQALALIQQLAHTPGVGLQADPAQIARLCQADQVLYAALRQGIREGRLRGARLRRTLERFTSYRPEAAGARLMGYDALDDLWAGVCGLDQAPVAGAALDPEMVHLEHTPARVILALLDRWPAANPRCFVDIGAGLGQVALLVAALGEMPAWGIEVDPAYVAFGQQAAQALGLEQARILAVDARLADYAAVDLAFMFTPFFGQMLRQVLERLHQQAGQRPLWLASYGPSSVALAQEPWLAPADATPVDPFRLNLFVARA